MKDRCQRVSFNFNIIIIIISMYFHRFDQSLAGLQENVSQRYRITLPYGLPYMGSGLWSYIRSFISHYKSIGAYKRSRSIKNYNL